MTQIKPNPFETLQQIAAGYCLSRGLHVVANLAVADRLDETPRTAAELAVSVGAHPEALGRVLRLLSAHGVFESCAGKFRHSPASRMLRTDHPQSMRDYVRMFGLPPFWATFGELEQSVRTGLPVGDKVTNGGFWAYLAQHAEANAVFNATMVTKAHTQIAGVLAAYDFSEFKLIGDIGGGRGHLLSAVLARRRAAPSHARLLLIEEIVPDDPGPAWSKMLDIHMLALIGGKQRSRREYEALFDAAGFSFKREIDTGAGISILEAT